MTPSLHLRQREKFIELVKARGDYYSQDGYHYLRVSGSLIRLDFFFDFLLLARIEQLEEEVRELDGMYKYENEYTKGLHIRYNEAISDLITRKQEEIAELRKLISINS